MLPIEEFKTAVAGYRRQILIAMACAVLAALAFIGLFGVIEETLRALSIRQFGEVATEVLMGLTLFLAVLIFFGLLVLGDRVARRDERLRCPSCGQSLEGIQHLVIATRNCGHCGKRVLAEPEPIDVA